MRTLAKTTVLREYFPSGGLRAKVYAAGQGKVVGNPAADFVYNFRRRLNAPRRPDCIVYDPAGKPIAIIDGETRKRRPYVEAEG